MNIITDISNANYNANSNRNPNTNSNMNTVNINATNINNILSSHTNTLSLNNSFTDNKLNIDEAEHNNNQLYIDDTTSSIKIGHNYYLNYDYITIAGGGIKGIGYTGALDALDRAGILKNIKGYSGSSVGSVLCMLLNLSYTVREIKDICFNINFEKFKDPTVSLLINSFGFDNGSKINKLLYTIIKQKQNPHITFIELFNITGKMLAITGSNINKCKAEYFSHITTPNMQIVHAIRISIAFPIYFTPVKIEETLYSDGGLFEPCPIKMFPDKSKILAIVNKSTYNLEKINSFEEYLYYMIMGIGETFSDAACAPIIGNIIYMDFMNIGTLDFNLTIQKKQLLYDIGYYAACEFIVKKRHMYYIIKKFISSNNI